MFRFAKIVFTNQNCKKRIHYNCGRRHHSVQPNLFPFFPLIHTKKRIFANEYRLLCRIGHKNNKLFLNKKLEITDEKADEVSFTAIYPAGTPLNINPQLLLDFLKENYGIEVIDAYVLRKNLFDKDMNILQ